MDQHKLIFNKASELMKSIIQSPVPVIAKVNIVLDVILIKINL